MTSPSKGLLHGIKVIELGHFVAAPNLGSLLSFLGAEVVKIEPLKGEVSREMTPWAFYSFGFNKKSVCIDLAREEGREIFYRLAKTSDVLIENLSPDAVSKLDIAFPKVSEANSRIIYCSIKGFSSDSAQGKRPAFDTIAQAEGGLIASLGRENEEPIRINNPCVDMGASAYALASVAMALLDRGRTGQGRYIEVPLVDVALYWSGYWISYYSLTGHEPARLGSGHAGFSPYGIYGAKDGHVFIGVITDEQWISLCETLNLKARKEIAKMADRVRNRKAVDEMVRRKLRVMNVRDVLAKLSDKVPSAPIRGIRELAEDQEFYRRGILREEKIGNKAVKVVLPPMKLGRHTHAICSLPPQRGRDTEEILLSLGYTKENIGRFMTKGVVA